jgi:hypothetical protein
MARNEHARSNRCKGSNEIHRLPSSEKIPARLRLHFPKRFFFLTASLFLHYSRAYYHRQGPLKPPAGTASALSL